MNVSETDYNFVKDQYTCDYRGEIEAKGKVKMYFVDDQVWRCKLREIGS